jgi:hypothetical protein
VQKLIHHRYNLIRCFKVAGLKVRKNGQYEKKKGIGKKEIRDNYSKEMTEVDIPQVV